MDEQDQIQCAHESCRCTVDTSLDELPHIDLDDDSRHGSDASLYCSAGCASGLGCDHPDCECASAKPSPSRV